MTTDVAPVLHPRHQLMMMMIMSLLVTVAAVVANDNKTSSLPHTLQRALDECRWSGPLGMTTGDIKDWQISSSSTFPSDWDAGCHERYARLYQQNGLSWCAKYKSPSEWLQIDLGVPAKITGVMTQGRSDGAEWVTSFMMSFSLDAFQWQYVRDLYDNQRVFEGNVDSYSVKHSYLDEPILARFVKFHTIHWNRHPSLRVELVGCQVCKSSLAFPPYSSVTASSEKRSTRRTRRTTSSSQQHSVSASGATRRHSCHADDAFIFSENGWCSRQDNEHQWLQFDIGPPTLMTGVVTRGRGDGRRKHWVTRFRLSYSNSTQGPWHYYKDANHLDTKDFGGNVDKDIERVHYLNCPFTARYVRFHPVDWHRHISMRAGLIGCPFTGECGAGFMRVNSYTPCVVNLAYQKESFVSSKRAQHQKRHSSAVTTRWTRGHAGRAVDGQTDQRSLHGCTTLDNFYVDRPVWMVDLGHKTSVSGVIIVTWRRSRPTDADDRVDRGGDVRDSHQAAYTENLDKLAVYVTSRQTDLRHRTDTVQCGFVTRLNDALFKPRLHVQCSRVLSGRYVLIEALGVSDRWSRLFTAVLCEVMVYQ